jgi:DNA-binding transcriptional regulator YiaG
MNRSTQLKALREPDDGAALMATATPEALADARHKLEWTQQEMAYELGLCRQHVSDMERGRQPIERRTWLSVLYLLTVYG